MRIIKFLSVALLTFGVSFGALQAQGFGGPAELPPASYKGKQFVDSRGCVFIRAGFSGQVRWIPRVTRSRKQLCGASSGQRSTKRTTTRTAVRQTGKVVDPLAGAPVIGGPNAPKTTAVAAAAPKATTRTVRQAKPAKVVAPTATRVVRRTQTQTVRSTQPKTTTRVVRRTQPQTTTRVVRRVQPTTTTRIVRQQQQQARIIRRTQPKTVTRVVRQTPRASTRVVPQAPQTRTTTRVVRRTGNCDNASAFSAQFINQGARCGPQTNSSREVIRQEVGPQSQNILIGPKGANRRIAEARELTPPKGYKAAWSDGRLNPLRGVGTTSGKQQMQLVWSNDVPRRLLDPRTGKPVDGKRKLGLFGF